MIIMLVSKVTPYFVFYSIDELLLFLLHVNLPLRDLAERLYTTALPVGLCPLGQLSFIACWKASICGAHQKKLLSECSH